MEGALVNSAVCNPLCMAIGCYYKYSSHGNFRSTVAMVTSGVQYSSHGSSHGNFRNTVVMVTL